MPTLYPGDYVATLDGEAGYVWAMDRGGEVALVAWPDAGTPGGRAHITVSRLADLLTDVGRCTYGGPAGSPTRCDADTLPGRDLCPDHGGPDFPHRGTVFA